MSTTGSIGQGSLLFRPGPLTLPAFIAKWQKSAQSERASVQSHFRDLCGLLEQPDPSSDPDGTHYAFEKSVTKTGGGAGYADVWKRSHFAWEYKGKHKNLVDAYRQLLGYREALDNPPLLIVCDLARFEVHTNFTDTAKKVYAFGLADLLLDAPTPTCSLPPMDVLRALFEAPERLRPERTTSQVTEEAAKQFSRLAESLRARGNEAQATARFLIRLLFCLFAEDVGLLPGNLLSRLLEITRHHPEKFARRLSVLFGAMSGGGDFLYVALRELLDLEKEVISFAAACDLSGFFPSVGPEQMRGVELNEFAAQLAPITVNIGYIQWKRDNAFGQIEEPILKHTKTILQQDALVAHRDGLLVEPAWPEADVIVGNPPFLGGSKTRQELGDGYVSDLFKLYEGRVPAFSDLVCYWFERARALIESGEVKRAGLLATNRSRTQDCWRGC